MAFVIFLIISFYLFVGAMLGGIVDDSRNKDITDGLLNGKKYGVLFCVLIWPVLIVAVLIITVLNTSYLLGKKIKNKWWHK